MKNIKIILSVLDLMIIPDIILLDLAANKGSISFGLVVKKSKSYWVWLDSRTQCQEEKKINPTQL